MTETNIISRLLCKHCRNKLIQVTQNDILYKKCIICDVLTRSERSEYIIKSTLYSTNESDMVINKSIVDDPCLPIRNIYCPTCESTQLSKYIRNDDTLYISHVICMTCNKIRKYNF